MIYVHIFSIFAGNKPTLELTDRLIYRYSVSSSSLYNILKNNWSKYKETNERRVFLVAVGVMFPRVVHNLIIS